jgi:hypothetical protein
MTDVGKKDQLMKLVEQIVPSQMKHHAEAEACDLLMEVERLDILEQFVDQVMFSYVKQCSTRSGNRPKKSVLLVCPSPQKEKRCNEGDSCKVWATFINQSKYRLKDF